LVAKADMPPVLVGNLRSEILVVQSAQNQSPTIDIDTSAFAGTQHSLQYLSADAEAVSAAIAASANSKRLMVISC
jgi:hypothetical protein